MKKGFGELELAILEILKSGERMSVKEVLRQLQGENKYTTVMTIMNRLVKKNLLAREKKGLYYEYAILTTQSTIPSVIQKFMQKLFGIKTGKLVSHLIDVSEDITLEELEEIEKMVVAAKKVRKSDAN